MSVSCVFLDHSGNLIVLFESLVFYCGYRHSMPREVFSVCGSVSDWTDAFDVLPCCVGPDLCDDALLTSTSACPRVCPDFNSSGWSGTRSRPSDGCLQSVCRSSGVGRPQTMSRRAVSYWPLAETVIWPAAAGDDKYGRPAATMAVRRVGRRRPPPGAAHRPPLFGQIGHLCQLMPLLQTCGSLHRGFSFGHGNL